MDEDPKPAGTHWTRVEAVSDEFEGLRLDLSKWQRDPTANGWRWIGRPPGLFCADGVSVGEGQLRLTVGKLDRPVVIGGRRYTHRGAIVRSLYPGRVGWYFECRMRANATVASSTFWLNPKPGSGRRLELDIQECVGRVSDKAAPWGRNWDHIFHSNLIDWTKRPKVQIQGSVLTPTKNWERFYVYGAWWKSPDEVMFFLDGKHVYTLRPKISWNEPSYIQMASETYDWNPIPNDNGLIGSGTWEQRTTRYDWVRVWKLVTRPAGDPGDVARPRK